MTFNRNSGRIASFVAAALIAGAVVPAAAMADPEDTQRPAAEKSEAPKLSRAARNMVWCVAPNDAGPDAKKVCKTRAKWIAEGKDPFAK